MLLALLPQGPAIAGVDLALVTADILPALGASSFGDLSWCTQAELLQWADETAKRLAHRFGVFVEWNAGPSVLPNISVYAVPPNHLDMLRVAIGSYRLRPSSVRDLLALDSSWQTTTGPVQRYSMDANGTQFITLYPQPLGAATMTVIFHRYPPTIAPGTSAAAVASPIADYFAYSMLAEARRKESEARMEEMAEHFQQRVALFEQIIEQYWGQGQ